MENDVVDVVKDLIQTLEDGCKGFDEAARKLRDDGHADLAEKMSSYSEQRRQFSDELKSVARTSNYDIGDEGSFAGALHRGWMALKDALTGDDAHAILAAAESGEDHAVSQFEDALAADLPAEVRAVIVRQASGVRSAHDAVKAMRDQN
jgi:uncharacterized protein (TIGR02284 family)